MDAATLREEAAHAKREAADLRRRLDRIEATRAIGREAETVPPGTAEAENRRLRDDLARRDAELQRLREEMAQRTQALESELAAHRQVANDLAAERLQRQRGDR